MGVKWRAFLAVALLSLAVDQALKWAAREYLAVGVPVRIVGEFFGLVREDGAVDVLGVFGQVPPAVILGIAALGLGLLASLLLRSEPSDRLAGTAIGCIVGGGVGNLLDRFYLLQVIDFLRFDLGLFAFPTFNPADLWIAIGVGLLLLDIVASEASEVALGEESEP